LKHVVVIFVIIHQSAIPTILYVNRGYNYMIHPLPSNDSFQSPGNMHLCPISCIASQCSAHTNFQHLYTSCIEHVMKNRKTISISIYVYFFPHVLYVIVMSVQSGLFYGISLYIKHFTTTFVVLSYIMK